MKKSLLLVFLLILPVLFGCSHIPFLKKAKAEEKAALVSKQIDKNQDKIEDKGRAFVYGAGYSNKQETNRSAAIDISSKFIDFAQLTLGNPSIQDAQTMREITDGLMKEIQIKTIETQLLSTNVIKENKQLKDKLNELKQEKEAAEEKLQVFDKEIVKLQKNDLKLKEDYEIKLKKVDKINEDNAIKANKYDIDNSFINSINPFHDLFKFFKKLGIWVLVIGFIVFAFKIAAIFGVPGLGPIMSIFGGIFGFFGKQVFKLLPEAKKAAGVVSSNVLSTLSHVIKANEGIFKKLEEAPIEEELIENYPETHQFNKNEVKNLLFKLTDNTIKMLENELKHYTDEESRAVISKVKVKEGIKNEAENVEI